MPGIPYDHDLVALFRAYVQEALSSRAPGGAPEDVEDYVTGLLVQFTVTDAVFAIRDESGRPLTSVYEMLAEADVRLRADSFEREREVHKHIGDYILFWSGVNPGFLRRLRLEDGRDLLCDYTEQGRQSYHIVSTFDYRPYEVEAPTFRRLSARFEETASALAWACRHLPFRQA